MALVFTILVILAVLILGYYLFEKDENHDEWGGW